MFRLFFNFSFVFAWSIRTWITWDTWDATLNRRIVVWRFIQKVMLHTIGIRNQGCIQKSRYNCRCQKVAKYPDAINEST